MMSVGADHESRHLLWIMIASAIMSWLVAFGVVNMRNQFIRMVVDMLYRLTEPVLRPIRRILPNLGGVDISPVVLLLGCSSCAARHANTSGL